MPVDLEELSKLRVLVAGEVGIDEYIWGRTRRISPEAPVPVVEVEDKSYRLGLSGNVAQNIASLGADVHLLTVRGTDADGEMLETMLQEGGVLHFDLVDDASRPTLRKTRILAQRQHVVRVDYERCHPLDPATAKALNRRLVDLLPEFDGIILQDYAKGMWNPDTVSFIQTARKLGKPVFVDPSRMGTANLYRGCTLLTPNISEAEALCKRAGESFVKGNDDANLQELSVEIQRLTEAEHVVITCGEWGMVSWSPHEKKFERIPTYAREVSDVTGAGDTVVSVLALMYLMKQPLSRCIQVANAAAGLVVGRLGASSVTREELMQELTRLAAAGIF